MTGSASSLALSPQSDQRWPRRAWRLPWGAALSLLTRNRLGDWQLLIFAATLATSRLSLVDAAVAAAAVQAVGIPRRSSRRRRTGPLMVGPESLAAGPDRAAP
jgi:hypothetical protein